MIVVGARDHEYDVVLAGKYSLGALVESIDLEEALGDISMTATAVITVSGADFPNIDPGLGIVVVGQAFDGSGSKNLLDAGVVWSTSSSNTGTKHITIECRDLTIYLSKSEDQIAFPAGQTASDRIRQIAKMWNIPVGNIPNTGIKLAAARRDGSFYDMIRNDLVETAMKGGSLYNPRWSSSGLELYQIGTNTPIWILDTTDMADEVGTNRTLEGAITRVKVVGQGDDKKAPPVLAVQTSSQADQFGLIQKLYTYDKAKDTEQASKVAQAQFRGMTVTHTFSGIDINTVRAGDKIMLDDAELIVMTVKHSLGNPGRMSLELAPESHVRREFFTSD